MRVRVPLWGTALAPLLLALTLCAVHSRSSLAESESNDALARKAHSIFARHCAACHGADIARPKGRFGHVLDLERLARERRHIRPGDPDGSRLYLDVVQGKMPPPESGRPPVTSPELSTLREWILAGAPALPANEPAPVVSVPPPSEPSETTPQRRIGQFHPLVVHFPVALLITAVLAELIALLTGRKTWSGTARYCLLMGSLGAVLSSATGWAWALSEGFEADTHRWLGIGTTAFALATSLLAIGGRNQESAAARWLWRLALLATTALVALTGYQGGLLTYGPQHHTWPF